MGTGTILTLCSVNITFIIINDNVAISMTTYSPDITFTESNDGDMDNFYDII